MTMTTEEKLETMRKVADMYETGYKDGKVDVCAVIVVIILILTLTICVVIGTGIIVL